jgi:hypothetical protein
MRSSSFIVDAAFHIWLKVFCRLEYRFLEQRDIIAESRQIEARNSWPSGYGHDISSASREQIRPSPKEVQLVVDVSN